MGHHSRPAFEDPATHARTPEQDWLVLAWGLRDLEGRGYAIYGASNRRRGNLLVRLICYEMSGR